MENAHESNATTQRGIALIFSPPTMPNVLLFKIYSKYFNVSVYLCRCKEVFPLCNGQNGLHIDKTWFHVLLNFVRGTCISTISENKKRYKVENNASRWCD